MKTPLSNTLLLLCLGILAYFPLQGATFPYFNDFSGTDGNTAFTYETTDAEWALNNGSYRNTYSNSTITPSTASFALEGVTGQSFVLQSQFTVASTGNFNANPSTLGFGFFSNSTNFNQNVGSSFYLADLQFMKTGDTSALGTMRILALGDSTGYTSTSTIVDANPENTNLAIVVGTTYTLRLEGIYDNGTLSMSFGLYDATGSTQIGSSATATDTSPLTGEYFGYRDRIGLGGGTAIIDYDNYSVAAVPEPGHWASLASIIVLAGVVLGRFRLRDRAHP